MHFRAIKNDVLGNKRQNSRRRTVITSYSFTIHFNTRTRARLASSWPQNVLDFHV